MLRLTLLSGLRNDDDDDAYYMKFSTYLQKENKNIRLFCEKKYEYTNTHSIYEYNMKEKPWHVCVCVRLCVSVERVSFLRLTMRMNDINKNRG